LKMFLILRERCFCYIIMIGTRASASVLVYNTSNWRSCATLMKVMVLSFEERLAALKILAVRDDSKDIHPASLDEENNFKKS